MKFNTQYARSVGWAYAISLDKCLEKGYSNCTNINGTAVIDLGVN